MISIANLELYNPRFVLVSTARAKFLFVVKLDYLVDIKIGSDEFTVFSL